MSTTDQVERLLDSNSELRRIHDALDSYDGREEFCRLLDDMLDNHDTLFGPHASPEPNDVDLENFSATARSLAKKYVDRPIWHTPWLTRYFLVDVLEGQHAALSWTAQRGIFPERSLRNYFPLRYRTFLATLTSVAFFVFSVWLLYWLINNDHLIAAALLGILMLYFYLIEKPLNWWR
jgi:hypothetical protein